MSNAAPYEVNVVLSDDETFAFSLLLELVDGTGFPFDDYAFEYVVTRDGRPRLSLDQREGIAILDGTVTFKAARGTLCAGLYRHGCRIRNLISDDETQLFDGSATINQGNFT